MSHLAGASRALAHAPRGASAPRPTPPTKADAASFGLLELGDERFGIRSAARATSNGGRPAPRQPRTSSYSGFTRPLHHRPLHTLTDRHVRPIRPSPGAAATWRVPHPTAARLRWCCAGTMPRSPAQSYGRSQHLHPEAVRPFFIWTGHSCTSSAPAAIRACRQRIDVLGAHVVHIRPPAADTRRPPRLAPRQMRNALGYVFGSLALPPLPSAPVSAVRGRRAPAAAHAPARAPVGRVSLRLPPAACAASTPSSRMASRGAGTGSRP